MNPTSDTPEEEILRKQLRDDPSDWQSRRSLAHALYDNQSFAAAADVIWDAPEIPSTDIDLAFASRILAKARPRRAIRLLTAVLEQNRGKAVQNMGMANALLHHGMVLQAARFYGAALEVDPTLANPDLEHFVLWTDDEQTLWGDFQNRRPKLGELPWMARDEAEAQHLHSQLSRHTTPVYVPKLPVSPGEALQHQLYQQEAKRNVRITPPPAVTIPIGQVDPKHRRFDDTYGAEVTGRQNEDPEGAIQEQVATRPIVPPPSRLTPSPDAPSRKTAVMPIQFPPPTTSLQTVKAPEVPAKSTILPPLPPVDPANATRRRLIVPGLNQDAAAPPARPGDDE